MIGLAALGATAHPLQFNLSFFSPGQHAGAFGFSTSSAPSMAGTGTLNSLAQAAASRWENALLDPLAQPISVRIGWSTAARLGAGVRAAAIAFGATSGFTAEILVNRDFAWFADGTPDGHDEYSEFTSFEQDVGGGLLNVGRVATATSGIAFGREDLLTVLLHELGHTIALDGNSNQPSSVTITSPRPFAGSQFTLAQGAHISSQPNALMFFGQVEGHRIFLSDADILVQAELLRFNNTSVSPTSVPEPVTMALLAAGAGVYVRRRRRG